MIISVIKWYNQDWMKEKKHSLMRVGIMGSILTLLTLGISMLCMEIGLRSATCDGSGWCGLAEAIIGGAIGLILGVILAYYILRKLQFSNAFLLALTSLLGTAPSISPTVIDVGLSTALILATLLGYISFCLVHYLLNIRKVKRIIVILLVIPCIYIIIYLLYRFIWMLY